MTSVPLFSKIQTLSLQKSIRKAALRQCSLQACLQNKMASIRLIDIGANLLDSMYEGVYNDKKYHNSDLDAVLRRSWDAGVQKIIITAGNLQESQAALEMARTHDGLYCTVGCHPTRCKEFESWPGGPDDYFLELRKVIKHGIAEGKVVAVGECGLDYDRLHFCDVATQKKYFERQFELAHESGLPMFLHLRAASKDFLSIIREHEDAFTAGVVHSFDGTLDELQEILAFDKLSIGINGCSLKTPESLLVAAAVPLERLMIETDCPWCDIRSTHAGKQYVKTPCDSRDKKKHDSSVMVKGRNEPCNLRQVLEVLEGCRSDGDAAFLAERIWHNTGRMFFPAQEK